jgi:hypothetical protein
VADGVTRVYERWAKKHCRLEQQSHLDQVPQLTVSAYVSSAPSLFHEVKLPVQGDRGVVVGENAQRQLV